MRIQHNITAMNSYRNFSSNNSKLSKNLEKLSSGYNINRAGDDAAGLAISEKMRVQISGLEGAKKNAKDGISLIQTAEGALTETHDMLNRMVTLAEQSANGTYQDELDREQLQKEVESLKSEIDRIADSTNFNGLKLLDGSLSSSAASGSAASTAVSGIVAKNGTTVLHGAQGDYTTESFSALSSLAGGDKLTMTVNYTDRLGNDHTYSVEITYTDGTKGTFKTSTGKEGTINDLSKSATKIAKAFRTIMNTQDTDFASQFTVATAGTNNTALKFTSKEAGSEAATIAGGPGVSGAITFSAVKADGTAKTQKADLTQTDSSKITAGVDHAMAYKIDENVWNISDKDNLTEAALASKTFTVGGKKFVFVSATANSTLANNAKAAELLKKAGIDGYVTLTTAGSKATGADVWNMVDTIEKATGLDLVQGTVTAAANWGLKATDIGSGWAKATVGTKAGLGFYIKGATASSSGTGGGLTLQIGDTSDNFNRLTVSVGDMHAKSIGIGDVDISTQEGATTAIDKIKQAVNNVSDTRGTLGALQNRLDHTINNIGVMQENIQSAESTIRDTDVAEEMMKYTKNNILNQSAQAMLAQANQLPQGVLQLLQ